MAGESTINLPDLLAGSSRRFRREVLALPIVQLEPSLRYMTVRRGIHGSEVVGTVRSGAQLRPYRMAKDATNTSKIEARELKNYLGDIVEEFDPYALYETIYSEPLSVQRDRLAMVRTLCLEMARSATENLALALFTAKRNAEGNTTMDLFDGFDTIIEAEKTATNIASAKGNLQALGEITPSTVGDVLKEFYRSCHTVLKNRGQIIMFIPTKLREMYDDWYAANFQAAPYNTQFEQTYLQGTGRKCVLVDLPGMDDVKNIFITTRENLLVGVDQLSDKERFEVRRPDNPKAVQFFMTMYFGCDFQSIDPRTVNFGSFTIGEDTADVSTEPEETLQEDDPETV